VFSADLWLAFYWSQNTRLSIKITNHLYSKRSKYQKIDVFESVEYGRVLALDEKIVVTEKEGFISREMTAHPAMCVNPKIKKVLLAGAGCGAVNELVRYTSIRQIDIVQPDEIAVSAWKLASPAFTEALKDSRVSLHILSESDWLAGTTQAKYDLMILLEDSERKAAELYFNPQTYQNCHRLLSEDGILIHQLGSPYFEHSAAKARQIYAAAGGVFPISKVYQTHISTARSGYCLFHFLSKTFDPLSDADYERWRCFNLSTKYYNSDLHWGAFMLPSYVQEMFE